jgi:hypothetical protein
MPITTWNYTADPPAIRHIGPMAQDFAAAFQVGADDRHIHPVDAWGVAFAAIQGLFQVLHERLTALEVENSVLRAEVEAVKRARV